jgi:ankyrin repeat protein
LDARILAGAWFDYIPKLRGDVVSDLPLIKAASKGNLARVRELLADGHRVDERGEPLTEDEMKAVKWSLNSGASLDSAASMGRIFDITPLMAAAESGSGEIVDALLSAGADVNAEDSVKRTALMIAAFWKHEEIAIRLVEKGSNPNAKDLSGDPVLTQAASSKLWRLGNVLLDSGASANPRTKKYSAPLIAASSGEGDDAANFIHRLLDAGAKPTDPVVLSNVVRGKNVKLIRRFIAEFPEIVSETFPGRLLEVAAHDRDIHVIQTLLDCGVIPTNTPDELSALSAVISGPPRSSTETHSLDYVDDEREMQCLDALVKAGADINHARADDSPPLHEAIFYCRSQLCGWLLDHGADPNRLCWGKTHLEYARERLQKTQPTHMHNEEERLEFSRQQSELVKIISMLEVAEGKPVDIAATVPSDADGLQRGIQPTLPSEKRAILSTPPAQRRGLCDETFFKAEQILIRADIDDIADVIQKDRKFDGIERDVYGRLHEIDQPVGDVLAMVKFKGQNWVYVARGRGNRRDFPVKAWSKALKAPVLRAGEQSVASVVYYALYDRGVCIESFESDGQWFRGGVEIDPEVQDDSERMHGTVFSSSLREADSIDWSDYRSEWEFLDRFLRDQNAYLTFVWAGFAGKDKRLVVTAYNEDEAITENIERVDLAFYKPTAAQKRIFEQRPPEEDLLLQAIKNGDAHAVSESIAGGAELGELPPGRNESYLLVAIQYGAYHKIEEIVDLLLRAGADPNFGGEEPILPRTVQLGGSTIQWMKAVAKLLDAGADVDLRKSNKSQNPFLPGGQTALIKAASTCKLNYVKLLLKYGADPTIADDTGRTALDYAENWLREVKKDQLKDVPSFTDETYIPNAQAVVELFESAIEGRIDKQSLPDIDQLIKDEEERIVEKRQREGC